MFGWIKNKGNETVDYAKKVVGTEEVVKNAKDISSMGKRLLTPSFMIKNARQETFEEAKRRLGVDDIHIKAVRKNYVTSFYICIAFAVLCLATLGYSALVAHSVIQALASLSIGAACMANAFRFSFRSFQIKHRSLCAVKDWYDRPNEWFPKF